MHPWSLTWKLKMMAFNRHLLFQGLNFRFHVKLQGFAIKHDIMISWQLFRQQNIMKSSYSGIGCLIVRIWSQSILKIKQRALCVTWTNKLFDWHLFVIKSKMTGNVYDRSQYIVRQCFVVVCCDFWFFLPGRNLTRQSFGCHVFVVYVEKYLSLYCIP